jgi:hypothetical protein
LKLLAIMPRKTESKKTAKWHFSAIWPLLLDFSRTGPGGVPTLCVINETNRGPAHFRHWIGGFAGCVGYDTLCIKKAPLLGFAVETLAGYAQKHAARERFPPVCTSARRSSSCSQASRCFFRLPTEPSPATSGNPAPAGRPGFWTMSSRPSVRKRWMVL